jgi:hypothetical protein
MFFAACKKDDRSSARKRGHILQQVNLEPLLILSGAPESFSDQNEIEAKSADEQENGQWRRNRSIQIQSS